MSWVKKWPAGLRFHPTDAELVDHYLRMKLNGETEASFLIPEPNIYKFEPWDLFSKYSGMVTFSLNPFSPG